MKKTQVKNLGIFCADEIITTSHPYNILNNPTLTPEYTDLDSKYLRYIFLEKAITSSKIKKLPKIYINRKDATALRYIINIDEVENILSNLP